MESIRRTALRRNNMGKYRRKPEIVEARQFIGDNAEKLVGWDSDNIIISSDGIVC